jgi:hypothetical protein
MKRTVSSSLAFRRFLYSRAILGTTEHLVQDERASIERQILDLDQEQMLFRKMLREQKSCSANDPWRKDRTLSKYKDDRERLVGRLKALPDPAAS